MALDADVHWMTRWGLVDIEGRVIVRDTSSALTHNTKFPMLYL